MKLKYIYIYMYSFFFVVEISSSQDSLASHLTNPLFVVVTFFLSCLLLTVAYLPVAWFPWVMYLTGLNLELGRYSFFNSYLDFSLCFFS